MTRRVSLWLNGFDHSEQYLPCSLSITEGYSRVDSALMHEYSSIRRVKPLPKRRRTTGPAIRDDILSPFSNDVQQFLPHLTDSNGIAPWPSLTQCYQPIVPSSPTDVSHLDGYASPQPTVDFHSVYKNFSATATPSDDDDHLEDSGDHLQQPGNKKKRKVPVTHELSGGGTFDDLSGTLTLATSDQKQDDMDGSVQHENDGDTQPDSIGRIENVLPSTNHLSSVRPPHFRASVATLTGLKRKEMIRMRKRQVIGIIEGLPQSDPLALEYALAAPLSWYCSPPKHRPRVLPSSTRNRSRQRTILPSIKLSEVDFTFQCHSPG